LRRVQHKLALICGQIQRNSALIAGVSPEQISEYQLQNEALNAVRNGRADAYASTRAGPGSIALAIEFSVAASPCARRRRLLMLGLRGRMAKPRADFR
jgi:polar amino acid transport system substrate-binding protein